MRCALTAIGLSVLAVQTTYASDRVAQVDKLVSDYNTAEKAFYESPRPDKPSAAEQIRSYEAWPGWQYIPQLLALAEEHPDDEAAYRSCQWIIDRTSNVGNMDKAIFEADSRAWEILAAHHTHRADLPMMCLKAVQYFGPAREQFLRGLLAREDLSRENMGFAAVALAEYLAHKHDYLESIVANPRGQQPNEFGQYIKERHASGWDKDLVPENAARFKAESIELFREVLDRYADVPVTITAPYFRDLNNLGEKANKSLHALEHLTIGAQAPNIIGKDLHGQPMDLRNYRGHVVVVTFWFTGCGPCMQMIPQERRLIDTYKDRPFALLGVSTDESLEQARKTAADEKMDWPCWFDGEDGSIARDFNVLRWPTIYVLDKNGFIVAKNLRDEELDEKIAELMEPAK